MVNKPDDYKVQLLKQHMGHCGTRVQVGYYPGNINRDLRCLNYGDKETIAHSCVCPNEDRIRLFTEGMDELNRWIEKNKRRLTQKLTIDSQCISSLEAQGDSKIGG